MQSRSQYSWKLTFPLLILAACGHEGPLGEAIGPIIGGAPVDMSQFYATVGLDVGGTCTGTLIQPDIVVTAAHCVTEVNDATNTLGQRPNSRSDHHPRRESESGKRHDRAAVRGHGAPGPPPMALRL